MNEVICTEKQRSEEYKVLRDGKVAVLVSPRFGAGWYTWNTDFPECLFDADVVAWVENGKPELPRDYFKHKFGPTFYDGGARNLKIVWVPIGTAFRIEEYDGRESLKEISMYKDIFVA